MKKVKFFVAILTLIIAIFSLSSCASDVVAYSPDSRISIVYSESESTVTDRVGYNKIVSAIKAHIGDNCRFITDVNKQKNFEIVVGESNRDVTKLAKEFLAANTPADGDTESYVFYYKDNSIAIVASSEFSMEIAVDVFIERYLSENTLIIRSDMLDFKAFSKTAHLAELDAKIEAEEEARWESRWDEVYVTLGQKGTEAIQRLYEFWGTEWLEWAIGLYDPDEGGFYYSASARDYIGYSPDIESTAQVLSLLKTYGLCDWYDGYWGAAFPAEFRSKLATFVQKMQDKDDGYFYHPQWGKNISTAAKGRHLDQGLFLLGVAGESPLYPSPLDRQGTAMGEGTSDVISAFMDTEEHKSSVIYTASTLPDYMQSEEAMLAYLEAQKKIYTSEQTGIFNSYSMGHLLSSQHSQLRASGLAGFVCEWLDSIQIPETGLWEPLTDNPDSGYNALSGVVKLSGVYSAADRPFKYADKMVDTAIEVILNDRPAAHVCYIFNPIGAFASIISSMKATGNDISEARNKIFYHLPEMIDATIEKQEIFKKELGSFSYLPDRSDPASQGLRMSLGLAEGDVNATTVSIDYVGGSLFDLIGVDVVPMFRYADFKKFCSDIAEAGAPVKSELLLEVLDFEDGDIPTRVTVPEIPDLEVEVVDNGRDGDDRGQAMQIHNVGASGTSAVFSINMDTTIVPTCTTVELDMNFMFSRETGNWFSLYLRSEEKRRTGFELQFNVIGDGTIAVHQTSYTPDNVHSDVLFTVPMEEWFKLRIEYYPISSSEMRAKVYVDGVCVHISDTPHYNSYSPGVVYNGMNRLSLNCFKGNESILMLDNIDIIHDAAKTFDDSDYNAGGATE